MFLKEKDISLIRKYFSGKPVLKAYLFGSYSRSEADNNSDIDILVDLDYSRHIGFGFVQMKLDLEQQLNKTVDLVSSQAISKHLLPFINKDKQLIYDSLEKNPAL
ncbi:putative nucleotidyltransferase [Russula earlei]|uniref:Nucleotidyltransferase n=1 Tax=Russula earlei TaxID=71964 RepID=A0ACC0TUS3_9AGAM|nr:putative nucleotidyltransferase [Russula earlei]